jgi:hypothetical protein
MSTLDRVKILKESINDKINQSRNDMHESHNPVYNDKIWIEIETVEWVLGRINQLEDKKRQKIYHNIILFIHLIYVSGGLLI